MATGPGGHTGTSVAPTVLSVAPPAPGPVSSFDLGKKQKSWVVIGICLNRLLLPVLRDFVGQEIPKHYTTLKTVHGINTQLFPHRLLYDGPFKLNYGSINNNWGRYKKKVISYDYKVNTAEDLAKLYLEPHMAKFTGFDNTCDLSAVLGILANASVFPTSIQTNAENVRSKVRNKWGHCNFDLWTDVEFTNCFQLIETMVRSLRLLKADEDKQLANLRDWETKGVELCMGHPVDKDLMKLISVEVANLEKEVENIKNTNTDDARKIRDALQTVKDEIEEFDKRIADIERKVDEERRERLEKERKLAGAIGDISSDVTKLDKRQDAGEVNISMLEIRQGDLETTISSIKDEQHSLTSDVGALKIEQSLMNSRLKALEDSSLNPAPRAKIVQLPSRNPCFCGRDCELDTIAAQLRNKGNRCVHTAICGLGGVGKTSLAIEFLCSHEKEYAGGIFWISGEDNNLFQRSFGELARQIGTFESDFSHTLSRTLDWLRDRKELWCLVVDNLDELEVSSDMRKLLTGHWKHAARGHVIITTRREVAEIGEETGIEQQCCIELKCLTEDEGIQFLRMRTGREEEEEINLRELVRELGGLPLALDQAAAYIRCLNQSIKEYVKKYKEQNLLLLKKKKARHLVDDTSPARLAVHTTWKLNFDHISHISEEMDLGQTPTRVMWVCGYLGPDDIPYELINEGLGKEDISTQKLGLWEQAEIVSLLTKFSLFQRHIASSFSVHRLVQEVIRGQLESDQTELFDVLSCAVSLLHHAFESTRSPASVCESFVGDAVFSVENPPSLHLWGKLALHATYLQDHLRRFASKHEDLVHSLLYTEETVRLFNEAGVFFSVSQEKVKAQEMQQLKLESLVNLKSAQENGTKLPYYFVNVPLKDRDYKLISHCMRQPIAIFDSGKKREEEANQLREQGNVAVKRKKFEEATELYSSAVALSVDDCRLFFNRALCYLKLGQPEKALIDCQKCLSLNPQFSKALHRKAWALKEIVRSGSVQHKGEKSAAMAMAVHFDASLRADKNFCEMFPELKTHSMREIQNESQLIFALMTTQGSETMLVHEGEYNLNSFVACADIQIVGLGRGAILTCKEMCSFDSSSCYLENVIFPKGNVAVVCQGKETFIHLKHCKISGGRTSCEDFPECNGGPGCIATSLGKPVCDRTGKFGKAWPSGNIGCAGIQIVTGSAALVEDCLIHDCGGGGALVAALGSRLEVRRCEVYSNHQAGLEGREGGKLVACENRIYSNYYHGILIGPDAGECDISCNKIFENSREGILVLRNTESIVIRNNDVHHNGPFGLSLENNSRLLISNNKIFENGFWGILAQSRTSANVEKNAIFGNKCGGILVGLNYSGRIYLDSNVVRDHSGPWLLSSEDKKSDFHVDDSYISFVNRNIEAGESPIPQGETAIYSTPPTLINNTEYNNEEGMYHPKDVVERIYSGCTFCRSSKKDVRRLFRCSSCYIASYCCKECQRQHWPTHKSLCNALKSRFSVTVKPTSLTEPGTASLRTFGTHLKGIGTGPKPKRDSCQKFIVKIQTGHLNSHPLQLLTLYDKSLTLDCSIQSPEIFHIVMECGVLGALNKFTSKKVFFWAMFAEKGEKLTIFLDHLAPFQEW